MKKTIIITAAGQGVRIGGDVPKQFQLIGERPILIRTVELFHQVNPDFEIIVTLPEAQLSYWLDLCEQFECTVEHSTIVGGATRSESIRNALEVSTGDIIGIHDGVRPFVSPEVIVKCYAQAEEKGNAVPVYAISESIRKVAGGSSASRNRDDYKLVQTPQVFKRDQLIKAYYTKEGTFSDDASLVESIGYDIHVIPGNSENIKITTPFDLKIANLLLSASE